MTRPRRLFYFSPADSYYYIIGGKKKKVKVDNRKITQKQLAKINITNIIGDLKAKRVKRRKKRKTIKLQKSISDEYLKQAQSSFGWQFYIPKKEIPELAKIQSSTTSDTELAKTIQQLEKTPIPKTPIGVSVEKPKKEPLISSVAKEIEFLSPIKEERPIVSPERKAPSSVRKKLETDRAKELFANYVEKNKRIPQYKTFNKEIATYQYEPVEKILFEKIKREFYATESSKGAMPTPVESQEGEGVGGDDNDGLYNDELQKLLFDKTNKIVPVIAKDELQQLLKYVEPNQKYFTAVINTNPSQSDGSGNDGFPPGHWTAIFIDNRDDYPSAEWYDPLAGAPDKQILTIMKRICETMNKEKMFLYKQNMVKNQNDRSANCGYFCLKFIDDRVNGVSFSKATGFDDIVDRSKDGEIKIEKYKSYL